MKHHHDKIIIVLYDVLVVYVAPLKELSLYSCLKVFYPRQISSDYSSFMSEIV